MITNIHNYMISNAKQNNIQVTYLLIPLICPLFWNTGEHHLIRYSHMTCLESPLCIPLLCGISKYTPPPHPPTEFNFFPLITFQKQSLARDNLSTRQKLEDLSCLFCSDLESVHHLLFECAVATKLWNIISDIIGFSCGQDFLSIAKLRLSNKNFVAIIVNYICCPIGLWKLRNSLLF